MRLIHIPKLLTTFLFALALAACGKEEVKEPLPRQVKIFVVGQDAINSKSLANSNKDQKSSENLGFDAGGKVIEVLAKIGSEVVAGQALGRLMPSSMSMSESSALTSYRAARAEIQSSEADFKRYTELREKNFISASEYGKRIATIELARAKFESTMEQLGFVTLRAIESGTLIKIDFQIGQQVLAQQPVAKIKLAAQVKNQLTQVSSSGTAKAGAFQIPSESIHGDGVSVYRVKLIEGSQQLGTLEIVKLSVKSVDDSRAEVVDGLKAGDLIVATGWHALTVGQKVRIGLIAKVD
jgi:multidrug efflux pump subunit AcrA (membrane-fusion protein)